MNLKYLVHHLILIVWGGVEKSKKFALIKGHLEFNLREYFDSGADMNYVIDVFLDKKNRTIDMDIFDNTDKPIPLYKKKKIILNFTKRFSDFIKK